MDKTKLEKYSSAFTLSDMEIFIFPELLYALVLANIMSPEIWKWRDDKWFGGIDDMPPLKKMHRVKQYIMDHYNFNLDLETWGLTDKQTEINRFSEILDPEVLSRSNALFGYEGDKYYFDIDIRKHFGLDQYDTDIIPYWKTETVEAMNAFRFKEGHTVGAGECVSLACLYAAAMVVVAKVPPEKIFLMGTPLHSQNFVVIDEGILTNNRRIVTKSMWYNGTELSSLARRALEHEQVTIVAHSTGYIHSIYGEATIDPDAYHQFREHLAKYLETSLDYEIFINFLRDYSRYQKLFQVAFHCQGAQRYILLERAFGYEHGSKYRLGDKTSIKLLCDVDEEDLFTKPQEQRIILNASDPLFKKKAYQKFLEELKTQHPGLYNNPGFIADLKKFVHLTPRLPSSNKTFSPSHHLAISPDNSREEIITYLSGVRKNSIIADLAFYAGREMDSCDWKPFLKAAFERNPVSLEYFRDFSEHEVYDDLISWPGVSIYSGNRMAQPDEVVNYKRGDGLEKAIVFVHHLRAMKTEYTVKQEEQEIVVKAAGSSFKFKSSKTLKLPPIQHPASGI